MKKILLGLFFVCTVVTAGMPQHPKDGLTLSQKSGAAIQAATASDLLHMHKYFKGTYYPLIKELREGGNVTRDDILSAYSRDPFLKRVHDGGHGTFVHTILPLKFCVIAHGSGDINVGEREGHHASLQIYVNVIKLFFQPLLDMRQAITDLDSMSATEWKQAYQTPLKNAVTAFNALTSADWDQLIKAQKAAFEEYSRD